MSKLDDIIEELRKEFVPTPLPQTPEDEIKKKQKEFFFGKPKEYSNCIAERLAENGRCPACGELGRVHLSVFICSIHGEYEGKVK